MTKDTAIERAIVMLYGYPAAGKLTVATELVRQMSAAGAVTRLVDNHYVNNPIFGLLDIDGLKPVPSGAWGRIREVRTAMIETVRTISPPKWSFVFTNYLAKDDDEWVVDEMSTLARDRGSRFLLVRVECELDELAQRIGSADRRRNMKWADPEGLRLRHAQTPLIEPSPGVEFLAVDTTRTPPRHVAAEILARLRAVSRTGDPGSRS